METNPGPRGPVPTVCRLLCSNVRGLAGNLSDLTVASSQYDILLCSVTLVSDMRHVSELLVSGFGRPVLLCQGRLPRARGMAAYVRDGYGAFRQTKFRSEEHTSELQSLREISYAVIHRARGILPRHNKTGQPNPGTSNSNTLRESESKVSEHNNMSYSDDATVRSPNS